MSRIILTNVATPATPSAGKSAIFISNDATPRLKTINESGVVTIIGNSEVSSTTASSGSIANADTKIGSGLLCPANTITAGTLIRYTILGTSTTSAAGAQVFTVRFGANNTVADTAQATYSLAAATSGTGIVFKIVINVTIRTIGALGTLYGYGTLLNGDSATTGIYTKAVNNALLGSIATINTTAAGYFGLSYISGNASTACTFQQVITEIIRQ